MSSFFAHPTKIQSTLTVRGTALGFRPVLHEPSNGSSVDGEAVAEIPGAENSGHGLSVQIAEFVVDSSEHWHIGRGAQFMRCAELQLGGNIMSGAAGAVGNGCVALAWPGVNKRIFVDNPRLTENGHHAAALKVGHDNDVGVEAFDQVLLRVRRIHDPIPIPGDDRRRASRVTAALMIEIEDFGDYFFRRPFGAARTINTEMFLIA